MTGAIGAWFMPTLCTNAMPRSLLLLYVLCSLAACEREHGGVPDERDAELPRRLHTGAQGAAMRQNHGCC